MPAVVVTIVAGDHVPLMPLLETSGKVTGVATWQYSKVDANAKVGVIFSTIVTLTFTVPVAHSPASGVKV